MAEHAVEVIQVQDAGLRVRAIYAALLLGRFLDSLLVFFLRGLDLGRPKTVERSRDDRRFAVGALVVAPVVAHRGAYDQCDDHPLHTIPSAAMRHSSDYRRSRAHWV